MVLNHSVTTEFLIDKNCLMAANPSETVH
jgi:hypothetical protein